MMKTGTKIAVTYSTITMSIIIVVIGLFYLLFSHNITLLYYDYLTEKAYAAAQMHWEKDETDAEGFHRIEERYAEALPVSDELVFNADSVRRDSRLFGLLGDDCLALLKSQRVLQFEHGQKMGVAVYYPDNEGNFIVVVLSENLYGKQLGRDTLWLLSAMVLVSTLLIYVVGRFYAIGMVNRIDSAYQSEKAFVRNASHELGNPLTAIQGDCEISLMRERSAEDYQMALKRIEAETKKIIALMEQLLVLSHGKADLCEAGLEDVNLSDFLREWESEVVSVECDSHAATVSANPYLLRIAVGNIVNNACKYSAGRVVKVTLRKNVVEVEDQGIGIPRKELRNVFQPFYRASNAKSHKGHGIGLSLSKHILEAMGATIFVAQRNAEQGTVVRVSFSNVSKVRRLRWPQSWTFVMANRS